jgi:hypothetical protein
VPWPWSWSYMAAPTVHGLAMASRACRLERGRCPSARLVRGARVETMDHAVGVLEPYDVGDPAPDGSAEMFQDPEPVPAWIVKSMMP